jgi:hypothetical protein
VFNFSAHNHLSVNTSIRYDQNLKIGKKNNLKVMGAIKLKELNRIVKCCYCQLFLREMNPIFDELWRACLLQKIKSFVMTTMYLLFSEIYNCYLTCRDHITL